MFFLSGLLLSAYAFAQWDAPDFTEYDDEDELALEDIGGDEDSPDFDAVVELADEVSGEEIGEITAGSAGDKDCPTPVLTRTPIKVVPGFPGPNSRKVYRLQVGAYAITENANIAERELKTAGFETRREARGSLTRVLAVGIRADEVRSAVQLIESLGFGEVWIRE